MRRDSLGGQNSHRRVSGARSSRALSAIFKRLRDADCAIHWLKYEIRCTQVREWWGTRFDRKLKQLNEQLAKLDAKRKALRHERKQYHIAV